MFEKKTIESIQRVGYRLRDERENKKVTREQMARALKVNKEYIIALENCQFSDIPFAPIYLKNLVRHYAEILNLPTDIYVTQFVLEELHSTPEQAPVPSRRFLHWKGNVPNFLRLGAIATCAILLFVYLGSQIKQMVEAPPLTLLSPENGMTTTENHLMVQGQTDREVQVSINGKEVPNSENGHFQETITLSNGVNTLVISARKKHGGITSETRYVILQGTKSVSYAE